MRSMTERYRNKVPITGEDLEFVLWLLSYHPNVEKKLENMEYLCFDLEPVYERHRCLYVYRHGFDIEDISWTKALTAMPVDHEYTFKVTSLNN
jgi:hypothetical protein